MTRSVKLTMPTMVSFSITGFHINKYFSNRCQTVDDIEIGIHDVANANTFSFFHVSDSTKRCELPHLHGDDIAGIAVAIGAPIGALAPPSEVLVSQTVLI